MNLQNSKQELTEKISTLSQEQIELVWRFIESIESSRSPLPEPETKTVLERMGGYPEFLMKDREDLCDRDVRRMTIADKIRQRQEERHG